LALLAILDLARPYAGRSLEPWQTAAGFATLILAYAWLKARGLRPREAAPLVALGDFLLVTYLNHSRSLESDGILYYSYLRSLLFDGDLQLGNDLVALGSDYSSPNVLPVGAPLLWSPLVVLVHVARQGMRLFGAGPPTGVEAAYQAAACLSTLLYGAAGLFLLFDTLKRWFSPAAAFWATVICWVGSPLRFYLSVLPSLAHGAEFFAVVLVLRAYLALRRSPGLASAAWAGAACGLAFLTRSQDGILLALPGLELGLRFLAGPERRRWLAQLGALCGGFLLAALPQLAVWQAMFGVPVLVPHKVLHGDSFMHLGEPQLLGTLLSPRGGLFASHPALLVALLGLVALALGRARVSRPQPFRARYLAAALPVLLLGWYVNSTVFDWYQVRRFTGLVPLLAPGLAWALTRLSRTGVLLPALLAFAVLRYDVAVDRLRPQPGRPVPVRSALVEMGDELAADTYHLLEPSLPRGAVALLSAYTGEPLLASAVTRVDLAGRPALLRLPRPARHLSAPSVEDGVACRWVEDRDTRFFLPLAWNGRVLLTVRARALETLRPQSMDVQWNGRSLGRQAMTPAWAEYRFRVPADVVHPGTNGLVLAFERAPIYRRMRGTGPRRVRPAALADLTLHRNED